MIEFEEDWLITLLPRCSGSVFIGASFFAFPAVVFAVLLLFVDDWEPGWRAERHLDNLSQSVLWSVSTAVLGTLLGFRTNTAFRRFWEGTGLLHQMRGEWFDTVSNCVTFSINASLKPGKAGDVNEFRHTLVRLMSLCHGSALEEIADNQIQLESIDSFGLDDGTLIHLRDCQHQYGFNKVEVMLHLVQSLITNAHSKGVIDVPPPILSRVYQTISRGFVNLLNAKKITDTKFPFPYAQLISFLILSHTILTPMMMSVVIQSKILAGIFTFLPIFGMASLNLTAIQLENPFGTDDNDLPLAHFQEEMNSCLLMLLHPNTNMMAGTSKRAIMGFEDLLNSMESYRTAQAEGRITSFQRLSNFEGEEDEHGQAPANSEKSAASAASDEKKKVPPPEAPPVAKQISDKVEDVSESVIVKAPAAHAVPTEATDNKLRTLGNKPSVSAAQADQLHQHLVKRMDEFNEHLTRWSQLVEIQVVQMTQSLDSLKNFGDQIHFPQASPPLSAENTAASIGSQPPKGSKGAAPAAG